MLRLERSSRDKLIAIFVRDKERFLSRPLLIAFSIAMALHLSLGVIFHISPFSLSIGDFTYPPANVIADPSQQSAGMVAVAEPSTQWIRGLPHPPASIPSTKAPPDYTKSRPIDTGIKPSSGINLFAETERLLYLPEFNPMQKPAGPPLAIIISGILASLQVVSLPDSQNGLPKEVEAALNDEARMAYSVIVDGRSGKVFWMEPAEQNARTIVDRYAEKLLLEMRFAKNALGSSVAGEVEIHLRRNKQ